MSSAGSTGGNNTDFPQAAATDPSRKQRSSSVWHSRYLEALAMIVRSSAAFGVTAGIACGTSVRYDHSRPSNAPSRAAAETSARPRSTTRSCRRAASTAASTVIACGTVRLDSVSPGSRLSACGERMVTSGTSRSGAISRSVRTGALSTSVTAHPAATRAWVTDWSQMAEPSSRFRSTSP